MSGQFDHTGCHAEHLRLSRRIEKLEAERDALVLKLHEWEESDAAGVVFTEEIDRLSEAQKVPGQTPDGEWCYDHDWQELIDPQSGGFIRCSKCNLTRDCEDPDGDLG